MNTCHRLVAILLGMGVLGGLPATGLAASASADLARAVSDPARPAADTARDADRKPKELIELTGIHAGSKIAEIMPGGGYFTRIFSKLAGPQGKVYAMVPFPQPNAPAGARDMTAPMRALAADANYPNIAVANLDPATVLPEPVDLVWTSLNYHDFHNRPEADLAPMNRMAFKALKPGGLYVVVDHAADKGSGKRDIKMHRIDPDLVRQEVTSAGFQFVQESNLLRSSTDDRKVSSHEVTRGKTDQFFLLFQKPTT